DSPFRPWELARVRSALRRHLPDESRSGRSFLQSTTFAVEDQGFATVGQAGGTAFWRRWRSSPFRRPEMCPTALAQYRGCHASRSGASAPSRCRIMGGAGEKRHDPGRGLIDVLVKPPFWGASAWEAQSD